MDEIEAFADAIMAQEGWYAGSMSNRHRNPGNLRDSHLKISTDDGYAVFNSLIDGYAALLTDIGAKFTGATDTGLGPASTVAEFFQKYAPASDKNDPVRYAINVCSHLSVALGRVITPSTHLGEIWQPVTGGAAPKTAGAASSIPE